MPSSRPPAGSRVLPSECRLDKDRFSFQAIRCALPTTPVAHEAAPPREPNSMQCGLTGTRTLRPHTRRNRSGRTWSSASTGEVDEAATTNKLTNKWLCYKPRIHFPALLLETASDGR